MWKRCRARFRKWAAALASVSHCSGMSCRNCKLCDRQSGTRSRRMQAWNSTLKIPVIFLFALVGLNYWPVFFGKVPLPTDIIIQFPPFQDYQNEATMNHQHAELGDTVTQFYIWRKFQGEAIRHGVLPLWSPHLLAGTPFQANTLSALFYPFNLLFVLLPMPYAGALGLLGAVFAPFHQNKRDFIFFMLVLAGSFCVVYGVQPLAGLSERMPVFQGLKKDEAIVLV